MTVIGNDDMDDGFRTFVLAALIMLLLVHEDDEVVVLVVVVRPMRCC